MSTVRHPEVGAMCAFPKACLCNDVSKADLDDDT
jgi:hypothetical protein